MLSREEAIKLCKETGCKCRHFSWESWEYIEWEKDAEDLMFEDGTFARDNKSYWNDPKLNNNWLKI